MYLDNHDYKNHDDLIIVTKNNHDISIFNDNCPTLVSWLLDVIIVIHNGLVLVCMWYMVCVLVYRLCCVNSIHNVMERWHWSLCWWPWVVDTRSVITRQTWHNVGVLIENESLDFLSAKQPLPTQQIANAGEQQYCDFFPISCVVDYHIFLP